MVFKATGAHTFKLKVAIPTRNAGKPRTFSTGAQVKAVAVDVERMVARLKGRREWEALEAVFDGRATLATVYDADTRGGLADLLRDLADADLDPLVSEWAKRVSEKYGAQVRAFIPEGRRFPASRFRRKAVSEFLAGLGCADPTKNRYRAALSVFAKWLVEREILDSNPVRDVAMYAEHDPRMVWMTWADAMKVADAADEPYRTLFRLMAATGIELGVARALTRQDVELEDGTIVARGSKTKWRNRVVRYEAWATANLSRLCRPLVGFAPLFPGLSEKSARWHFEKAQKAVGIAGHRLHDLRHTYAVNSLRQGYKPQVVAHQLGHRDATMVIRVYGRFIPDASDYTVTKSATSTSRSTRGKRA